MGVYNPNMEMPKNCTECIEFKDDCEYYWDYYCIHESRPNNCPLIEIDLVRCGECEHWNDEDHWCNIRDSYGWDYKSIDFCSYGERRTDEHNFERD